MHLIFAERYLNSVFQLVLVDTHNDALSKVQLVIRVRLLIGTMQVHVCAVLQLHPAVLIVLQNKIREV